MKTQYQYSTYSDEAVRVRARVLQHEITRCVMNVELFIDRALADDYTAVCLEAERRNISLAGVTQV